MEQTLAKAGCADELQELWQQYFADRDEQVRNMLVNKYMSLVNKIAAYYYKKRIGGETDFSDYQNLAVIGLIQAIEKYDPKSVAKFETFASYRIKGSILNAIRNFSEKNASISYECTRNQEVIDSLTSNLDSSFEESLFDKILRLTLNLSYSALLESTIDYDNEHHAASNNLDGYHHCEILDLQKIISNILNALPRKQQVIVRYYYYYELSFVEISALIGVSKGRVSQLHRQAIENIRDLYNKVVNIGRI